MQVVTFNLRCIYERDCDGVQSFQNRAGLACDTILAKKPDIIGFQEAIPPILEKLRRLLPEYQFFYNGRNADFGGEGLVLGLRTETVKLVTLDCFWLSETPYVPASRYAHQSDCPRICQMALVRDLKNGQVCRVVNNHLDHIDDEARVLGIKQVLSVLRKRQAEALYPVFVLGDFNATPDSQVLTVCKEFGLVDVTRDIPATFHVFGKIEPRKIDYIFTDPITADKVTAVAAWKETGNGLYLSDHYPMGVTVEV